MLSLRIIAKIQNVLWPDGLLRHDHRPAAAAAN